MSKFLRCVFLLTLFVACTEKGQNKITSVVESKDQISKKERSSTGNDDYEYLFGQANKFHSEGDVAKFKATTNTILNIAYRKRDSITIAKANVYFAEYYKAMGINDSSYFFYVKAENLYQKLKSYPDLADVFVRKADLQSNQNDFLGTEKSAFEALEILREYPNPLKAYEAYNLIGICSIELANYQKAIEYYQRALDETTKLGKEDQVYFRAISYNNIGNAYERLRDYKKSIVYFEQALNAKEIKTQYPHFYATLIDNIAYSKFKMGDMVNLPRLFFEALEIRIELELVSKIVLSYIHISEYYEKVGNSNLAIDYAQKALNVARSVNYPTDVLSALKQVARVDEKNANIYSQRYIEINDSIQQVERRNKDRFARIEYETDEIALENDKLAEQNRNLLYFFVGSLMIGLLLFIIRTQRARNRELLLIQSQQKANEEIYNLIIKQQNMIEESRIKEKRRIAQELHDGVLGRLFGTRLNLDSLNRMTDAESVDKRNSYLRELRNIEQDIREISHDLNRETYKLINNFLAILNNLVEEQKNSFRTEVILNVDELIEWDKVSNTLKINLYRIIQEALQNINKYADATSVNISIASTGTTLNLKVIDNGVGFDVDTKRKGIGIQNMQSRSNELNGSLDIRSRKGKGTTITASFPM